ncbi:MAG: GH35 family beta-galactosidase [Ginsengibacter sp.]
MRKKISCLFIFLLLFIANNEAQRPGIVSENGRHTLLVDGKPFFILGGQIHNSSAWPALLPSVWKSAEFMHLNTLEVPIYWEQIEPQKGKFDFSLLNLLLSQAKSHHVHLVLLWFGTWKNGSNHYTPGWMKKQADKYPNIISKNGKPVDSPSPLSEATLEADKKAFREVMRHLKKVDAANTVIMVQVENEAGTWGSVRDYSPRAQRLFEGQVPDELLKPGILKQLNVPVVSSGTWKEVFGDRADEYFHAWNIASFIGKVAAAGKKEYEIPMYTNAALRDPLTNPPATNYESGGPTDNVISIWKTAAPALDLVAPDIYLNGNERVLKVLDLYNRKDNTLFVPEAGLNKVNAKYLYEVLSRGGIGFAPFGIDNNGDTSGNETLKRRLSPYSKEFAVCSTMLPQLAKWASERKIKSAVEGEDQKDQIVDLGDWKCNVIFGGNGRGNAKPVYKEPVGKALFIELGNDSFLISGTRCHLRFQTAGKQENEDWQYLKVEEGTFKNGNFVPSRILNGDETDFGGPGFGDTPTLLRIILVRR